MLSSHWVPLFPLTITSTPLSKCLFSFCSRYIYKKHANASKGEGVDRRGIIVYLEYQSVCPVVDIGSSHPLPASECVSPFGPKEGATLSCGLGGTQFGRLDRKPCTLNTLWAEPNETTVKKCGASSYYTYFLCAIIIFNRFSLLSWSFHIKCHRHYFNFCCNTNKK
jgi:hypothetical protein